MSKSPLNKGLSKSNTLGVSVKERDVAEEELSSNQEGIELETIIPAIL